MPKDPTIPGKAWVFAAIAGVGAIAVVVLLFRSPRRPPSPPSGAIPAVEMGEFGAASKGSVLDDQAIFKDPTPLFLPTEWNSSPPDSGRGAPEGTFKGYPPAYLFSENELHLNLPPPIAVPANPADALAANPPGNPFLGMGRTDEAIAPLAPRWAFVEILTAATGQTVFSQALTAGGDAGEVPAVLSEGSWQPVEFFAAVDAAGLVGELAPTVRAETPMDDTFLQLDGEALRALENALTRKLRIGARLPPGFYRICVGP